jgi:hypothetical protein
MTKIVVLNPAYEREAIDASGPAPRQELLEPAVLTLIDNGKPNGRAILGHLADALADELPLARVDLHTKPTSAAPISEATAKELAARSTLVISGVGDCGGCSSCSLHDAIQLEQLGVPSVVIITEPFVPMVSAFAASLGMPGYPAMVVLPHPVSSLPDAELRRIASAAAPDVARLLTVNVSTTGA